MTHSRIISGSTALRRMHCTGSSALEASVETPDISSPAALRGTALHSLAAEVLSAQNPKEELRILAEKGAQTVHVEEEGEDTVAVPLAKEDIALALVPAVESVLKAIDELDIVEFDVEQRYEHIVTCDSTVAGTADFIGRSRALNCMVMLDFKFGQGIQVFPTENYQLAFYSVGAIDNDDPAWLDRDTRVLFVIVQPTQLGVDPWRSWFAPRAWLENFREQERETFRRINNGETSYKAGPHCKFCRAMDICPEQAKGFAELVELAGKPVEELDGLELAKLLRQVEVVQEYAKKLWAHATTCMEAGVSVPGYKLVEKMTNRTWKDPARVAKLAQRKIGLRNARKSSLLSPAAMEKAFHMQGVSFKPLAKYITRERSGVAVVPDDSPRPAVAPTQVAPVDMTIVKRTK